MVAMLLQGWQASAAPASIDALERRVDRLEAKINSGRQR